MASSPSPLTLGLWGDPPRSTDFLGDSGEDYSLGLTLTAHSRAESSMMEGVDTTADLTYSPAHPEGTPAAVESSPVGSRRGSRKRPSPSSEAHPPVAEPDLPLDRYLDRELSWLAFNERVLELAEDPATPLLERVQFLAIFASNLDEFFMVRVAGLKRRIAAGLAVPGMSGMEPAEILAATTKRALDLQVRHTKTFADHIRPALAEHDITIVQWSDLSDAEQQRLTTYFRFEVFPVLTPLAVDPAHPFPYISGLSLSLAVVIRHPETGSPHFARVKVPQSLPRMVKITEPAGPDGTVPRRYRFLLMEELIAEHLGELFPGTEVVHHHSFRVTRNEDLEVEEDDVENLLKAMEQELLRRRFGPPVRLEVGHDMDEHVLALLVRELGVDENEVFHLPQPLDLRGLQSIASLDAHSLHYPKHVPMTARTLNEVESSKASDVFAVLQTREVLLHHPYESFSTSVQEFLKQAAADPQVLAIKQTLYRTSGDSPIVDALIDAAEAGKQVLALVEIKARFDEEANITWARTLEKAGVHVVYGIVGLKTHAKLSLVVRREQDGLHRYCHIGTGNYNPKTARIYEDCGLLSRDPALGNDVTRLFNQLTGYAPQTTYERLLVAPRSLRGGLVDLIRGEVAHQAAGRSAHIRMKMNSLVDQTIIDELYRASMAGVQVDIEVRGICALRAGVPGLSENIRVRSILGRFLQHSRIYAFNNGGNPQVYIGSADMMHRNLDRRVEALVRITDPTHIADLVELVDLAVSETTSSWHLNPDGSWQRHTHSPDGEPLIDLQERLIRRGQRYNRPTSSNNK